MLKTCRICGIEKPFEEFYRDKTAKDGRQTICILCRKRESYALKETLPKMGYVRTEEQRKRMSSAHKKTVPWNKGTGGCKRGHDPSYYSQFPSGIYYCKECVRENAAKYRAKNRDRIRLNARVNRYGMALTTLEEMWKKQDGKCAICGDTLDSEKYRIDHDHTSCEVRGILCHSCNTGIGLLKDSPEMLINAARYLEDARDHSYSNASETPSAPAAD